MLKSGGLLNKVHIKMNILLLFNYLLIVGRQNKKHYTINLFYNF